MEQNTRICVIRGMDVRQVHPTLSDENLPTPEATEVIRRANFEAVHIHSPPRDEICFRKLGDKNGKFSTCITVTGLDERQQYEALARYVEKTYDPGQIVLVTDR